MTDFGVAVPEQAVLSGVVDLVELKRGLDDAERADLHSVWVMEGIVGPVAQLEPVGLLTYAAAVTSKVKLGLGVTLLPLRSPVQLAKALVTLDQLSEGRLIAGVGIGGDHIDFPSFGATRADRVRRFREGLDIMRQLWAGSDVTTDGPAWSLSGVTMRPRPIQNPLPVWIGASAASSLQRVVELGDGFMGSGSSTMAEFEWQVSMLREYLAEAGRESAGFPIAKRVYVCLDDDLSRAWGRTGDWFEQLYGDRGRADGAVAVGSVEACAEFVVRSIDAGADLVVLDPISDEVSQIRRFIDELIPTVETMR